MTRVALGAVDVAKDLMNGVGYILKAMAMKDQQPLRIWEFSFTWFVGIYTIGAMFAPMLAFATMFYSLLEDKSFRKRYVLLSIFMSPISGIVRYRNIAKFIF